MLLTLIDSISKQLSRPKGYARVLFIDFSAAFNSVKLSILLKRLAELDISGTLILWIKDFLSCRPQRVQVNGTLSHTLTLSTGCPQGSVLSPVLFSLFTNEFCINECNMKLIKYADDMALVSLPQNADPSDDTCFFNSC